MQNLDEVLVNIPEEGIINFVKRKTNLPVEVDLTKPLRCQHFPLLQEILTNPLQEWVSTARPNVHITIPASARVYYFHLFDGRFPDYHMDGVTWKSNNKMSLKLILFNSSSNTFKLKNNKTDEGEPIMRRQTWQGEQVTMGNNTFEWRKHEYKLIASEKYLKPEPDGTLQVNQLQSLQPYPVLVHYYRIKTEVKCENSTKKRKLAVSVSDTELSQTGTSPTPSLFDIMDFPGDTNLLHDVGRSISDSYIPNLFEFPVSETLSSSPTYPFPVCNFQLSSPSCMPIKSPDASENNITGIIKTFAPDSSFCPEYTKVLLQVKGFQHRDHIRYTYSCQFANMEIPAIEISPGVIEFRAPPQPSPGIVFFWVICKAPRAEIPAQFSSSAPFHYLPIDDTVALQLTPNYSEIQKRDIIKKYQYSVKELDLSNSSLRSLGFLQDQNNLMGLTLDNNLLSDSVIFPFLPRLRSLSINNNVITNLEEFMEKLVTCFPSLRCLSMINNVACPYFHEMPHRYYNYKIFVTSRLPLLTHLDGALISEEDKKHSLSIKM